MRYDQKNKKIVGLYRYKESAKITVIVEKKDLNNFSLSKKILTHAIFEDNRFLFSKARQAAIDQST